MRTISKEEQLVIESVKKIVENEIKPRAKEIDITGDFPWDTVKTLAENGFLSPLLPTEYGGTEMPFSLFVKVIEENLDSGNLLEKLAKKVSGLKAACRGE